MDTSTARFLRSEDGLRLVARLRGLDRPTPRDVEAARAEAGTRASAVLEQVELRERARVKFSKAHEMLFTRDGLEQASAEPVATHRARRFAGIASIVDVGCGIGGDLIPLARTARAVGIDLDAARLLLACHNLRVHGLSGRVDLVCADARTWIPGAEALFFDPSRRTGDRKGILSVEGMSPPLAVIRRAAERCPDLCVKMSPLLRRGSVEDLDPEIEHVSLEGECREAVVWCGRFRTASARATVLPSGESIEGDPRRRAPVAPAGSHLHDPDPALVASRLLGDFAERFGLALLDPRIAYLTGDRPVPSAMARSFRILERFPFQLKRLRRRIAAHGAGRIEIRKRGFPISPEELRAKLRPRGPGELTVVLARVGEGHDVFLAERDPGPAAP